MAICVACGAASAGGAQHCASCGRQFEAPGPAIGEISEVSGGVLPPPSTGRWGAGVPYEPTSRQPAALRWITGSSWLPALKAVAAPTVLLLVASLGVTAGLAGGSVGFDSQYAAALALVLAALGGATSTVSSLDQGTFTMQSHSELRFVPMTITLFWLLLLWLGLRAGLRARRRRGGQQVTGRQAAEEAARTALAAGAVTVLLGLLSGAELSSRGGVRSRYIGAILGLALSDRSTVSAAWVQAAGWTALLAGVLAFTVYGTDLLRRVAWQRTSVRGWLVGALVSGRALAVTVGLTSVIGFIVIAVQGNAAAIWWALTFLPNIGLALLGFGSGVTIGAADDRSPTMQLGDPSGGPHAEFSLFALHGQTANWYFAPMLAVAGAAALGWFAHRHRLDLAGRARLLVVHTAVLSLLMPGAGMLLSRSVRLSEGARPSDVRVLTEQISLGLDLWTVFAANLLWTAVAVFGVPALLTLLRKPTAAPPVPPAPAYPPSVPGVVEEPADPLPYAIEVLDSHGEQ